MNCFLVDESSNACRGPKTLSRFRKKRSSPRFIPTAATGVAHDGNRFYRVAHSRTDISRSVDGKSWETMLSLTTLPSDSRLSNIPMRTMRYLNGKYLIGGENGVFVSSDNGVDWEIDFTESEAFVEDIVWTGAEYLTVGGKHSGASS